MCQKDFTSFKDVYNCIIKTLEEARYPHSHDGMLEHELLSEVPFDSVPQFKRQLWKSQVTSFPRVYRINGLYFSAANAAPVLNAQVKELEEKVESATKLFPLKAANF